MQDRTGKLALWGRGRATGHKSIRKDVENAGARWVDGEVVGEQRIITSRNPGNPDAFCNKLAEEICEDIHRDRAAA